MLTKQFIGLAVRQRGRTSFISKLYSKCKILDVGCGNNSPFNVKQIIPNCEYTGIDIGDYNQSKPNIADNYIVTNPNNFTNEISRLSNSFDAVISSHNLEHCDDRDGTFQAMLASLKIGGEIYISFPCEDSIKFPKRYGTLNYFDDDTHKFSPPNFSKLIEHLKHSNFEVIFSTKRYKPPILWVIGLLLEPISIYKKKVLLGTWEYYGFESIIWAKKLNYYC